MNRTDTSYLEQLILRWQQGDTRAAAELIERTCQRLESLTRQIYRRGFEHVRRWEETSDILQRSLLRLWRSLSQHPPTSLAEYFGRAAVAIRRELIDLWRHYFGPQGMATHHDTGKIYTVTDTGKITTLVEQAPSPEPEPPAILAQLTEFHEQIEKLPEEVRSVIDLLYYQELTIEQAAIILGVSRRTVNRRWKMARALLTRYLPDIR